LRFAQKYRPINHLKIEKPEQFACSGFAFPSATNGQARQRVAALGDGDSAARCLAMPRDCELPPNTLNNQTARDFPRGDLLLGKIPGLSRMRQCGIMC
jgi:hypothetical protein